MNRPAAHTIYKPKTNPDDQGLIDEIKDIIEEFCYYGCSRRKPVNHKMVHRIFKERALLKKPKCRWIRATDSNHGHRLYPNLRQNMTVTGPNQA